MITVEGKLARQAQKSTEILRNDAIVTLLVDAGPGFPLEARLNYGSDHTLAEVIAGRGRRGAAVRIEAGGCYPRTDHGIAVVVLLPVAMAAIDGATVFL